MLDRPNPVGRPVEGLTLRAGWESFVGAGPMPMRHGLTHRRTGSWFVKTFKFDIEYRIIEMQGWQPDTAPGFGWELGERNWVNPSPNAPNLSMARAYPGTVMVEGTTLSEGPRHDAAARIVRRARHRCAASDPGDAVRSRRNGSRAARCAISGSSRRFTSMWASSATACRFTPRDRATIIRRSSRGASRRSPSRRSAVCIRTTSCGAISRTNMRAAGSRSMSSTAGRCCGNGWTTSRRRRRTSMR